MTSDATARAQAFVDEHLPQARGLGEALAELIAYPDEFVAALREGLIGLGDARYVTEQERVAPGSGVIFGVRQPILAAVMRQVRPALRETSPALALSLAERLSHEPEREFVFFAHLALDRSLPVDTERSWQLMRRLARQATDWIRVDSLAGVFARGILLEHVRWAEIEQLVFSANEWERRLVGATIATIPLELPRARRAELLRAPALGMIRSLIGDASEPVRKSLSWALRSWREVDPAGVDRLLREEAKRAAQTNDGNRAWVVRDAVKVQRSVAPAPLVAELRATLANVRRSPGSQSTSDASEIAGRFVGIEALSDQAVSMQGERQRRSEARPGVERIPVSRI